MFRLLLLIIVAAGIGIGLVWPAAEPTAKVALATAPPRPPVSTSYPIDTVIERGPGGHFYVTAEVNGQPIRFVVDTGASMVALTKEDARRAGVVFDPAKFTVVGEGASGPVSGQTVTINEIRIDQKEEYDVRGAVLDDGLGISLLGQSYLSRIQSVSIEGDRMVLR